MLEYSLVNMNANLDLLFWLVKLRFVHDLVQAQVQRRAPQGGTPG